jgi:hypothetical protein
VDVEAHNTDVYDVPAVEARQAKRNEQALVQEYKAWLKARGRNVGGRRIIPPGEVQSLPCDLYEDERQNLIEAKVPATRINIRMAIGQLLDYGRFVSGARAVLTDMRPRPDLEQLLKTVGISCVWREGKAFVDNAGGRFTS